jgi:serine protease inhibitor
MKRLIIASLFVSATSLAGGSYVENSKTLNHDCAKDPEVTVAGNSNTLTLTGECTKVSIAGNSNTLSIASAAALVVNGNQNTVAIEATDAIRVPGSNNTVTWKKPIKEKKPAIANPGTKNKITQAK